MRVEMEVVKGTCVCVNESCEYFVDHGGASDARRRERRTASEMGTGVAAERLVAHVTQPTLWEPGVT